MHASSASRGRRLAALTAAALAALLTLGLAPASIASAEPLPAITSRPALAPDSTTTSVSSTLPVSLTVSGLEDVPADQQFTVQVQRSGDATWTDLQQTTVGDLAAQQNRIDVPRSALTSPGGYFVQLTNWGAATNYYDGPVAAQASIVVVNPSWPEFTQTSVSVDRATSTVVELPLGDISGIPDDQQFAVFLTGPNSWLPVGAGQRTAAEIRANDGKLQLPLSLFPDDGLYGIEITNSGVATNYLTPNTSRYASVAVGTFTAPTLASDAVVTYSDWENDVALTLTGFGSLPGSQRLNVQIGEDGATDGWHPVRQYSVYELGWNQGLISVPRSELTEPGTYWVEITNWGMSPNYVPETFQLVARVTVAEPATVAFVQPDGTVEEERTVTAGADTRFSLRVPDALPENATLDLVVRDGNRDLFTADTVALTNGGPGVIDIDAPGSTFAAAFGDGSKQLTVDAVLRLPEPIVNDVQPARVALRSVEATGTLGAAAPSVLAAAEPGDDGSILHEITATMPVTVEPAAPAIALDRTAYTVPQNDALPFSVSGIDEVPADAVLTLEAAPASGSAVWERSLTVGEYLDAPGLEVPANLLSTVGTETYALRATVTPAVGSPASAVSPITVTPLSAGANGGADGGTGGGTAGANGGTSASGGGGAGSQLASTGTDGLTGSLTLVLLLAAAGGAAWIAARRRRSL